jgi:hypothetical protein
MTERPRPIFTSVSRRARRPRRRHGSPNRALSALLVVALVIGLAIVALLVIASGASDAP